MTRKGLIFVTIGTVLGIVLLAVGTGMIYEFKNIVYDKIAKVS